MHHLPYIHGFAGYTDYLSHLSYIKIFLAIILSGHPIPVPESVTLMVLGYLLAFGKGSVVGFVLTGISAVLFFDMMLYVLSLEGSRLAASLSKRVKAEHLERYSNASNTKLFSLILVSHFIPGLRFANPILAGVTKVPWQKFLLACIISAMVYAPFYILVGYVFHAKILALVGGFESLRRLVVPLLVILFAVLVGYLVSENRKKRYNKNNA